MRETVATFGSSACLINSIQIRSRPPPVVRGKKKAQTRQNRNTKNEAEETKNNNNSVEKGKKELAIDVNNS